MSKRNQAFRACVVAIDRESNTDATKTEIGFGAFALQTFRRLFG
jgi:hypothetical protein